MARVQVTLDIEEADLKHLQYPEGVILPTRVFRLNKTHTPSGEEMYQLQHATNHDAEDRAIPYRRNPEGDYPA